MSVYQDFSLMRYEDGVLNFGLEPPQPVGAWTVQFQVTQRFGSTSGLITKSISSGYNIVSGITVVNSGLGQMNIAINHVDTSGFQPGNYAYSVVRQDSGNVATLTEGYLLLRG